MTWHSGEIKSNQYPLVNQLILFSYLRTTGLLAVLLKLELKAISEDSLASTSGMCVCRGVGWAGWGVGGWGASCCVGFDCFVCAWIGSFWLPPTPTMQVSLICKLHEGANVSLCVCLYISVLCEWGELVTCPRCSLPPLRACWNHVLPPA